MRRRDSRMRGDLSVTALYTSQAWVWGKLPNAGLFDLPGARNVFRVTNWFYDTARWLGRDVPSMRHSLIHRHLMIDHLVRESGARQVIELAAGLSRRGATFSEDPGLRYVEVDMPNVVETKQNLLRDSADGRAAAARDNWSLVGADARTLDFASLVDPTQPVFVVAEGLFMYLDVAEQNALCRRIVDAFADCPSLGLVFDLLRPDEEPDPGPMMRALHRGMRRFTGGQGFERDQRTRQQVQSDVRDAGFDRADVFDAATVAQDWALPHADEPTRVVLFQGRRSK